MVSGQGCSIRRTRARTGCGTGRITIRSRKRSSRDGAGSRCRHARQAEEKAAMLPAEARAVALRCIEATCVRLCSTSSTRLSSSRFAHFFISDTRRSTGHLAKRPRAPPPGRRACSECVPSIARTWRPTPVHLRLWRWRETVTLPMDVSSSIPTRLDTTR